MTMAFRIAYYKVHYPLAFYAAYFTVRADEFDAQLIVAGRTHVAKTIGNTDQEEQLTQKKVPTYNTGSGKGMYCRGFGFMPVDLYKSDARGVPYNRQITAAARSALQGLGGNAAGA